MIIAVDIRRSRFLRVASAHQQRPTSSMAVKARVTHPACIIAVGRHSQQQPKFTSAHASEYESKA